MPIGTGVLFEGLSVEDGDDLTAFHFLHLLHEETPILVIGVVLFVGEIDGAWCQFFRIFLTKLFYKLDEEFMGILLIPPTDYFDPILQYELELLVIIAFPALLQCEEMRSEDLYCLSVDGEISLIDDLEEDLHGC